MIKKYLFFFSSFFSNFMGSEHLTNKIPIIFHFWDFLQISSIQNCHKRKYPWRFPLDLATCSPPQKVLQKRCSKDQSWPPPRAALHLRALLSYFDFLVFFSDTVINTEIRNQKNEDFDFCVDFAFFDLLEPKRLFRRSTLGEIGSRMGWVKDSGDGREARLPARLFHRQIWIHIWEKKIIRYATFLSEHFSAQFLLYNQPEIVLQVTWCRSQTSSARANPCSAAVAQVPVLTNWLNGDRKRIAGASDVASGLPCFIVAAVRFKKR